MHALVNFGRKDQQFMCAQGILHYSYLNLDSLNKTKSARKGLAFKAPFETIYFPILKIFFSFVMKKERKE